MIVNTYQALTLAAQEKAKEFIAAGGSEYDLRTSDDPIAVDYRALQARIAEEIRKLYVDYWFRAGVRRHAFLGEKQMIGPVVRTKKRRPDVFNYS